MPQYKNILAAIDLMPSSEMVGRHAADIAQRNDAALTLLNVVEYLPPISLGDDPIPSPDWMIDEKVLMERNKNDLEKFAHKLGITDASLRVLMGSPKHEIIRFADDLGADLIIVGSHGRHGMGRLLGSTADGVMHNAPCDVLAVRISG